MINHSPIAVGYVEPDVSQANDQNDETVALVEQAFKNVIPGTYNGPSFGIGHVFRGTHVVGDGVVSTNEDYILECGFITNSCLAHYVRHYRDQLSDADKKKVQYIADYQKAKNNGEDLPPVPEEFRTMVEQTTLKIWKTDADKAIDASERAETSEIKPASNPSMGRGLM